MDLISGAKRIIVAMRHTAKGASKIVGTELAFVDGRGGRLRFHVTSRAAVVLPTRCGAKLREILQENVGIQFLSLRQLVPDHCDGGSVTGGHVGRISAQPKNNKCK